MRRTTHVLLLCAIVCAAAAFFCGGCKGSDSDKPLLIWWQIGTIQPGFPDDQRVMSDYIQSKIGVRVQFRLASWAEAQQRFVTMVNAGEYFDIMFVDLENYNRFVAQNVFADITDMARIESPELWEVIPQILWNGVHVKGRIYAVPTYKDSSVTIYQYWDHDYVRKYNIDLSRSGWAHMDQAFRRVKEGEGARFHPYVLARASNFFIFDNYDPLLAGLPPMGVRRDDQQRRVLNTLEQPDILEILRYYHAWYQAGIINTDANLVNEPPRGKMFMMQQAWPSVAIPYAVQEGIARYDPVRFLGPYYSTGSIQGSMNGISSNSKYKKEALQLLELVNTDTKLRDMLAYGIEGKHFRYVNNGTAVERIIVDWTLTNYQQGNYFIITPEVTVPQGYWDEVRRQNEQALPSVMMGFSMDIDPVLNELANCKTTWEKYHYDIQTGAADPDTALPGIIADLNANGLGRIIAEAQRQVDEFYK